MAVPVALNRCLEFFSEVLKIPSADLRADMRLREDLHLDSLQRLELMAWLADRGVDPDVVAYGSAVTLADVAEFVAAVPEPANNGQALPGEGANGEPTPLHMPPPQPAGPISVIPKPAGLHPASPGARPTTLRNGRFELRPVTPEAVPFLYQLSVSEEVGYRWRFRGAIPNPETFQNSLWQGTLVQFLVVDIRSGEPVGTVVAYNADPVRGIAYIAAAFVPPLVLTGLPADAVDLFVRYVFQVWNFRKLYMEMPAYNYELVASGSGRRFDVEGILTEHTYYDGRYWDEYLLAIRRHHMEMPPVSSDVRRGGNPR